MQRIVLKTQESVRLKFSLITWNPLWVTRGKHFVMNKKNIRDLAYTAGVMDSDGCFIISRKKRGNCKYTQPIIVVQQIDTRIINFLFGNFGGKVSQTKERVRNIFINGKQINSNINFVWKIATVDGCYDFCKKIIPFLKIKQRQAELMFQFCALKKSAWKRSGHDLVNGRGGRFIKYTPQEIERMDKIYEQICFEKKNHFQKLPQNSQPQRLSERTSLMEDAIVQM